MTVVITMAGLGSRFRQAGFQKPKYMIEVRGKTLFAWSLESLHAFREERHIFIARQEDGAAGFIRSICSQMGINNLQIVELAAITRGQAETAMQAASYWQEDEPLLVYNIDTYVERDIMNPSVMTGDGLIPCFQAPGNHWSFVKLGNDGEKAIEVREKERISNNCSIGAYYFRSCRLYMDLYKELYEKKGYLEKGERYIAPMYNGLIEKGGAVYIQDIPSEKVHVLGTPEEVKCFMDEESVCEIN